MYMIFDHHELQERYTSTGYGASLVKQLSE